MILELDLGNTRAKWRVVSAEFEIRARGVAEIADWLAGRFPDVWNEGVRRVCIASVLEPKTEKKLIGRIELAIPAKCQIAKSEKTCAGVVNGYAKPEMLGVDRWLALIAAYKKYGRAVMVLDCGTALKIDVVNGMGEHVGGYIIPGAALMERALLEGTDRVRYQRASLIDAVLLGSDTRSCVQNGVAAALVGAVLIAIEQCRQFFDQRPLICVAGGLGEQLRGRLADVGVEGAVLESDLVLDGLRWALPQ